MGNCQLRYLRVAVTSRCNLRCVYCRPPSGAEGGDTLSRGEIVEFVRLAVACGIEKVRVTGGEPLLRPDVVGIVGGLAAVPGLRDLGLTTNATLLASLARPLRDAGLRRVNIGLSAISPEVYRRITRLGSVEQALAGLHAALDAGFHPVKVNVVLMRGINDSEIAALALLARDAPVEVRFVEYMPFCEPRAASDEPRASSEGPQDLGRVVHAGEVLACLAQLGTLTECEPRAARHEPRAASHEPRAVARGSKPFGRRYRIAGHAGTVGIIAPHSEPFCHGCNRVRLTADGRLRACLIEGGEQDILPLIRKGLDLPTLRRLLRDAAAAKPARHRASFRGEMHRIGG
ncbi:MAG: radical SAM protein [Planctomycetes bacterium]|nr:radical SAM protein [Planctomycetota bacterium]